MKLVDLAGFLAKIRSFFIYSPSYYEKHCGGLPKRLEAQSLQRAVRVVTTFPVPLAGAWEEAFASLLLLPGN